MQYKSALELTIRSFFTLHIIQKSHLICYHKLKSNVQIMANSLVVYVCLITNTFVRLGEAEKKLRYFDEDMDSSGLS